ncbi:hypothetical protein [Lysinibacillus sp. UGB7]|uniref:hypothetical protein n=1 Tax=Lysinibacillus TaxID=400634 RepID=UPI003B7C68B8
MTGFKDKLNRELGKEGQFSQNLKEKILQQTTKPSSKGVNWQYPAVLIATLTILFLFILVGPWTRTEELQTIAHLDEVMKQPSQIKKFTVIKNNDRFTFAAQKYAWNVLQENFKAPADIQLLHDMLEQASLGVGEMSFTGSFQDIYIEFEHGQILQLKMKTYETGIGFIDMKTDLFYVVEGDVAENMMTLIGGDTSSKSTLLTLLVIFLLTLAIVEYIMRRKLGIKRKNRYANMTHKRVEVIFSVFMFFVIYLFISKGWMLFKPVIVMTIIVSVLISLTINRLFGHQLKEHLISIVGWLIGILFLIVIIVMI